jgi:hypothetical protein
MNINKLKTRWIWFDLVIKTWLIYNSTIKSYKKHCIINDFIVFSTIIKSLRSWVFAFDIRKLKTKNVKTYLTKVKFYHVDMRHFDEILHIVQNNSLQRIINEIERVHEKASTRKKLSIIKLILMQLLKTLDTLTLLDVILHSTFILVFVILLRFDEITWINENIDSFFND